MRARYLVISALVLLSTAILVEVNAQIRWVAFSPPDKSFQVKLPRKPTHHHTYLNYNEEGLFEGNTRADTYDFSPNDSGTVGLITVFYLARPKSRREFAEESDSVMLFVGGDDKKFLKQASVMMSGLHGREYLYQKGSIRGRVLIVNAGKRIFFLQYHTEAGVLPGFVDRIFKSFRLVVDKKNRRPSRRSSLFG